MRRKWTLFACVAWVVGCSGNDDGGGDGGGDPETEIETVEAVTEAVSATLQISGVGGASFAGGAAACEPTVMVLSTGTMCNQAYNDEIDLYFDCEGQDGATLVGTANVIVTRTPSNCPAPTSIEVAQDIDFERTMTKGTKVGEISGSSSFDFTVTPGTPPASKAEEVAIERMLTEDGTVTRHAMITGTKTISFDYGGDGPEDDEKVVDGELEIDLVLTDVTLNVTQTDLTFTRDCCYPVSGTIDYVKSGAEEGEGSITFGPACGDAENGAGDPLELPACPSVGGGG